MQHIHQKVKLNFADRDGERAPPPAVELVSIDIPIDSTYNFTRL